jgi:hypothetical protein
MDRIPSAAERAALLRIQLRRLAIYMATGIDVRRREPRRCA